MQEGINENQHIVVIRHCVTMQYSCQNRSRAVVVFQVLKYLVL